MMVVVVMRVSMFVVTMFAFLWVPSRFHRTMNSGMTPRLLHHTLLPLLAFLKILELAQILLGNRFCRQISAVNFLFDLQAKTLLFVDRAQNARALSHVRLMLHLMPLEVMLGVCPAATDRLAVLVDDRPMLC